LQFFGNDNNEFVGVVGGREEAAGTSGKGAKDEACPSGNINRVR